MDFNVVWAIALAKTTLFVVTLLVNAFLNKDKRAAWAIAGIRAIFVEQSNDLALGVPIVNALYSVTHPLFINYEVGAVPGWLSNKLRRSQAPTQWSMRASLAVSLSSCISRVPQSHWYVSTCVGVGGWWLCCAVRWHRSFVRSFVAKFQSSFVRCEVRKFVRC